MAAMHVLFISPADAWKSKLKQSSLPMTTEILNQQFNVLSDYLDKYVNGPYL